MADRATNRSHAGTRLEAVWGPGSGRPVTELKQAVGQIVSELMDTRDIGEALRCIVELKEPLFGHETAKQLLTKVVETRAEADGALAVELLSTAVERDILSDKQVTKGVRRIIGNLPDFSLDVPEAPKLLLPLINQLADKHAITEDTREIFAAACVTPRPPTD
mmetsp:Transcript_26635/g.63348  ORF Transcript_26635/g.63348 Transcript_26635/m.63348 type:complete len:163 (+) Transcript_26635:135-623(+)